MSRTFLTFMTSFQKDGKPSKQEEETPEEKARQKEKEEWRIEGEAQEKKQREQIEETLKQQAEAAKAKKMNDIKSKNSAIEKQNFLKFYDTITTNNELVDNFKDIVLKEGDTLENFKDFIFKNKDKRISYEFIGKEGRQIEEDTNFNDYLKKIFTILYKINDIEGIEGIEGIEDTLKKSELNLYLGLLMRYDYIIINDGEGKVSGIKYTINTNLRNEKYNYTLAIIPLLLGIIVAFHINNEGKNEGEKEYNITLTKKEQVAQVAQQGEQVEQGEQGKQGKQGALEGGRKNKENKKPIKPIKPIKPTKPTMPIKPIKPIKPTKPTITGKKDILGKQRCIYKKAGDRKEYVKYKGDLITVKDYKKIISVKKTKK